MLLMLQKEKHDDDPFSVASSRLDMVRGHYSIPISQLHQFINAGNLSRLPEGHYQWGLLRRSKYSCHQGGTS